MSISFSIQHLDYLQRTFPDVSAPAAWRNEDAHQQDSYTVRRIVAIGKSIETNKRFSTPQNKEQPALELPTRDALIGLHNRSLGFAYVVASSGQEVNLSFDVAPSGQIGRRASHNNADKNVLLSLLKSVYPTVSTVEQRYSAEKAPRTGIILGVPSCRASILDDSHPWDRLIRAMQGGRWSVLVLAEPVAESTVLELRNDLIGEMRRVAVDVQDMKEPSPLADHYNKLLQATQKQYAVGIATGMWRTGVYLMGDVESYDRLASVWQGTFSGDQTQVQPMRSVEAPYLGNLASTWDLPDVVDAVGPGHFRHPYRLQSVLNSEDLALYFHLPSAETNGFRVRKTPTFGYAPQNSAKPAVVLGKVLSRENAVRDTISDDSYKQLPSLFYQVPIDQLTKHAFIAGVTGGGKTSTIFNILEELTSKDIPFLVIEPAKTEYRDLLRLTQMKERHFQVFTLGNELASPLRLNPLEVLQGTSIAKHIDMLKSLFTASFGLWNPLPQLLEQALYLVYKDKGWDILSDKNIRISGSENDRECSEAFPTLSELLIKVEEVTSQLKWDDDANKRMQGSLRDRLKSLTNGGRGRMLNTSISLPAEALFEIPTILELESIGDDDEKSFLMGLLLIRLAEYRRSPESKKFANAIHQLNHLLIFEEAHRLLANVSSKSEEGASNTRAKGVEMFANLLSEIRSYGQGVIIADQVPTKLAPDVIKNTNLKIAHRIVDLEDRKVLGASMVMGEEHIEANARLLPGTAAIFSEGDDIPLLVQIAPSATKILFKSKEQGGEGAKKPTDIDLAFHFQNGVLKRHRSAYLRHRDAPQGEMHSDLACDLARTVLERPRFKSSFIRMMTCFYTESDTLKQLWAIAASEIDSIYEPSIAREEIDRCLSMHAAGWYARSTGDRLQWSYEEIKEIETVLGSILSAILRGADADLEWPTRLLSSELVRLHQRHNFPYSNCELICTKGSSCLYDLVVSDLVRSEGLKDRWVKADIYSTQPPKAGKENGLAGAATVCASAATRLIHFQNGSLDRMASRRVALCFGQAMLRKDESLTSAQITETIKDLSDKILEEKPVEEKTSLHNERNSDE